MFFPASFRRVMFILLALLAFLNRTYALPPALPNPANDPSTINNDLSPYSPFPDRGNLICDSNFYGSNLNDRSCQEAVFNMLPGLSDFSRYKFVNRENEERGPKIKPMPWRLLSCMLLQFLNITFMAGLVKCSDTGIGLTAKSLQGIELTKFSGRNLCYRYYTGPGCQARHQFPGLALWCSGRYRENLCKQGTQYGR